MRMGTGCWEWKSCGPRSLAVRCRPAQGHPSGGGEDQRIHSPGISQRVSLAEEPIAEFVEAEQVRIHSLPIEPVEIKNYVRASRNSTFYTSSELPQVKFGRVGGDEIHLVGHRHGGGTAAYV
jgi:hypothetical protein